LIVSSFRDNIGGSLSIITTCLIISSLGASLSILGNAIIDNIVNISNRFNAIINFIVLLIFLLLLKKHVSYML
jgi:hypothetical protein